MENLKPLVSIILPVRQWRDTTHSAVSSLLSQSFEHLEILVVGQDDVSSLRQRLPADQRIHFIARRRAGIVGALNTGLAVATGSYIARMDDDDIAYPSRIETQLDYLRDNPSVQLCGARIRFIDNHGHTNTIREGNQHYAHWLNSLTDNENIRQACLTECPMPHPTLLAHRGVWQSLEGYRELDGPEDYDLILRAMLNGVKMGKPEPVLLDWREHPNRLTYKDQRYRREAFTQRRAWAASQAQSGLGLNTGRGVWLCGTGRNARHWHDALQALDVQVHGFVDINQAVPMRKKRHKPVITYEELPDIRGDALIITALTQPNARDKLLHYFKQHQWQFGIDYVFGG